MDLRKDLLQTSTGVGHHFRPGYYFPSSNFKTVLRDPLPPPLAKDDEFRKQDYFRTTTGTVHDNKYLETAYKPDVNPIYQKAPGHWKVNYVKDVHEKLQAGGWKKPLTMGNQISEAHDRFCNEPPLPTPKEFVPNPQGFNLSSHHTEGPSKKVVPTTKNEKMGGRPFYVRDKGVYDLNDTYLTTTAKYHRRFKHKELDGVAKKDIPTYWETEEYPKAMTWGFGLHHNTLPKAGVPRDPPPMRDEMVFKSATKVRRVTSVPVVPHRGMRSLYNETYQRPQDVKGKEAKYCPVDTPYVLPDPSHRATFSAPHMYRTDYQSIGSQKYPTV
ncbi:hypothetical protein LSAT2_007971 [Lamellibrachia satsuma]|nr:hypothetical protein LSAT2_007971 [Lamellibrachia satsuma]